MKIKKPYIAVFAALIVTSVFAARDRRPVVIIDNGGVVSPLDGYNDQCVDDHDHVEASVSTSVTSDLNALFDD